MSYEKIKLIVLDVDGTMTDGGVYIDNGRLESKRFHIKDGAGILLAQSIGIQFLFLTGRKSECVHQRAEELNIRFVQQGIMEKAGFLEKFMLEQELQSEEVAYCGDDLNDLKAMRLAGLRACPADAAFEVKACCELILNTMGGQGAVRELVELLLKGRNEWEKAMEIQFGIS
ncbi:3-deoxy-D-manno-octulosonate 8-phosphate phosphatase [Gorillibacterium sp. CAU 1737]|uniref:KdsC family phosphatase n=1 Tax=Gorillibacterium sp. CAU 1737 TaxID=3140362 RepID=UPI00326008C1